MEEVRGVASDQPPTPRRPKRTRLFFGSLALVLALGIGAYFVGSAIGVAHAASANNSQTLASTNTTQQTLASSNQTLASSTGTQTPTSGAGMVTCEVLTVTSVSGQTIVATAPNGSTVTIHTTSSGQLSGPFL